MAKKKEVAPVEETPAEKDAKTQIHEKIAAFVLAKTTKRIGRSGGKEIFDSVVADVFTFAAKSGSFRFPGGFGSLHVRNLNKGTKPKRLPSGAQTTLGEGRKKLRYVEGNEVKTLLGTAKKPKETPTAPVVAPVY